MVDQGFNVRTTIALIRAAFSFVDRNGDGRVDAEELKRIVAKLGANIPDVIIDQMIVEASKRGDGTLTEEEFFRWMLIKGAHHDDLDGELLAAFRVFDKDSSGSISIEELKEAMELIGEPLTDDEINLLVAGGDGTISFQKFYRLLRN